MSITTGWFARIGPWPPSCGSTAWSPGAQMVCAGTKPSAIMRVLTAERRSSAVNLRPSRISQPPRIRQPLSASIPARRPASAARSEASIARTSRGFLISRSGQNGSGPRSRRIPRRPSSCARPSGKLCGTETRRRPSCRSASAITSAAGARVPAFSSGAASFDHDSTRSTRGLRARPVQLQVAHHQDAGAALLDEEERVGCEEPRRIEDVRVGLGRGVDQPALRLSFHLRYRHRR